ncbi:MAG TPA: hypothetical protein VNJ07_03860 [Chitinophagales bacterium]|nr:hypothetical protein [Chitinophagales bacterium]
MNRLPRWLNILLLLALLAAAVGAAVFYFVTRQPESVVTQKIIKPVVGLLSGFKQFENVDKATPAFTLTSADLHSAFAKDEAQARALYEGKVIQVSGTVASIASPTDTNRVVLLEVDGVSNVSCQMDPRFNERLKNVAPGNAVILKGICNGSKKDDMLGSIDVLMTRCVAGK